MSLSIIAAGLALLGQAQAQYYLTNDFMANGDFFSQFSFFTGQDPTHGFVQYQSQGNAQNMGLIGQSSSNVYIGVDSTNVQPNGRPSVRITSNQAYQSGLFILDLEHMPGGICGTWPAFWTVGPNWPNDGEIDIIEGVHLQSVNDMTCHTSDSCTLANTGAFTGNQISSNCYVDAPGQSSNQGCTTQGTSTQGYGQGFNSNGGGVYAMEWVNVAISVWFFPRGSIPADITNGQPSPSSWGAPLMQLYGPDGCDIASHFSSQQIVFDNTFCGDWAGAVWGSSGCQNLADTCNDYVANNPGAFQDAYWSINSLKVYHINGQADFRQFSASTPVNASSTHHTEPQDVPYNPDNFFVPVSPHGSTKTGNVTSHTSTRRSKMDSAAFQT